MAMHQLQDANGHPLPPQDGLTKVDIPTFVPRARDWAYLEVVQSAIDRNGDVSVNALSTALKVTRQAIWKMRRRPGFREWLASELRQGREERWEQLYERCWVLAMRGSVKHAELIARVEGRLQPETRSGGGPAFEVHFHA
jgi:hypothetical protein